MFKLLERAVLVSIFHVRPIHLFDVPKKKNGYIDTKVARDVCAFGIYPDLPRIEAVAAGKGKESIGEAIYRNFRNFFGPEP